MKVILFGATGMVGQGVLRECLRAPDVERVLVVGRSTTGATHEKLREIAHKDFTDFSAIEADLAGYDACFFCLGVSSAGMNEADYTRVTYDYAMAAARALLRVSPELTFVYVSGAGTDETEKTRSMWARVKGRTENAIRALGFRRAIMFRPGYIQPMHGIVSKTRLYRVFYALLAPLYPLVRRLAPSLATNTESVGLAMLEVTRGASSEPIVENGAINALATRALAR